MFSLLIDRFVGFATQGFAGLRRDPERGDVPGWVLITLMTAGIVAVIWAFARDALMSILHQALDTVSPGDD
jgi:hypothetical protein